MSLRTRAEPRPVDEAPRTHFSYSADGRHHCSDGRSSRIAVHLPIVLFTDGDSSLGVDIETTARWHSAGVTIKCFDRGQQPVTYQRWLTVWGPAISALLKKMNADAVSYLDMRRQVTSASIGLKIYVEKYGRSACGRYDLIWDPFPEQGEPYRPPFEYSRECGCRNYRMVWSTEKGEAILETTPRRPQPWERPHEE